MLTARAEPEQRIEGLEIGVDDYIPKPFEPRELLLRLRNILRRGQDAAGSARRDRAWAVHVFHISRGELKRDEETIKLTERERDLLRLFAQRLGMPIQRHELANDEIPPAASAPSTCRSTGCGERSRAIPPTRSTCRPCAAKATSSTPTDY